MEIIITSSEAEILARMLERIDGASEDEKKVVEEVKDQIYTKQIIELVGR